MKKLYAKIGEVIRQKIIFRLLYAHSGERDGGGEKRIERPKNRNTEKKEKT